MNCPNRRRYRQLGERAPDEERSYKNFHGKTTEEAVQLFKENAFIYSEDVLYMPSRVFGYYLKAYSTYLVRRTRQQEDPQEASWFISTIDSQKHED